MQSRYYKSSSLSLFLFKQQQQQFYCKNLFLYSQYTQRYTFHSHSFSSIRQSSSSSQKASTDQDTSFELEPNSTKPVQLTERAIERMKAIQSKRKEPMFLRISVDSGGCAGMSYHFLPETEVHENDKVFEQEGVKVTVDDVSLPWVAGACVDFVDEMIRSNFRVVSNPQAEGGCSCHTSFRPKDEL